LLTDFDAIEIHPIRFNGDFSWDQIDDASSGVDAYSVLLHLKEGGTDTLTDILVCDEHVQVARDTATIIGTAFGNAIMALNPSLERPYVHGRDTCEAPVDMNVNIEVVDADNVRAHYNRFTGLWAASAQFEQPLMAEGSAIVRVDMSLFHDFWNHLRDKVRPPALGDSISLSELHFVTLVDGVGGVHSPESSPQLRLLVDVLTKNQCDMDDYHAIDVGPNRITGYSPGEGPTFESDDNGFPTQSGVTTVFTVYGYLENGGDYAQEALFEFDRLEHAEIAGLMLANHFGCDYGLAPPSPGVAP